MVAIRLSVLGLASMIILQGCGSRPSNIASTQIVMVTSTLVAMPTKTDIPSTSTLVPVAQPVEPTPDPFAFLFEDFDMKNSMTGWGTSWINNASGDPSHRLLHTADNGTIWLDVTRPEDRPAGFDQYFALDGDHAWVVNASQTSDASSYFPNIWRTTNGGLTWEQLESPVSYAFQPVGAYSISFIDQQNGRLEVTKDVAAGTASYDVFETSDSGKHWKQLLDEGSSTIYYGGEYLSHLALPSELENEKNSGCISYRELTAFFSNSQGVLQIFCDDYLLIYHSQDGGKSWGDPFVQKPSLPYQSLVDFIDANTGWYRSLLGISSGTSKQVALYITHDGGKTWVEINPRIDIANLDSSQIPDNNPVELLDDIHFFDSEMGVATSDFWNTYSLLLKTTDGGLTWSSWVPHWQPVK